MGSGEKQDGREHIERTARHLIEKGRFSRDKAFEEARKARIRNEQREDGNRK